MVRLVGASVSTHSHPKVAALIKIVEVISEGVSTHSHPKVAADSSETTSPFLLRFNTQPPEGGWLFTWLSYKMGSSFNTQPPEGGCIK